jgi:glycosyltransferase involved in cell wall biosynthesis
VRVGVDGRSLRAGRSPRGVASYLDCLLAQLEETPGDEYELPRGRGRIAYAAGALVGRPRLDRLVGGCDVFWAPAPAPLAVSPGVPLVLTVHDLSFEHHPGDYTAYERLWHRLARPRALATGATRVIAVSDSVRGQLLDEWRLPDEKVVTVRSGPGRPPSEGGRLPDGLPAPYLLAVGALEPRKRVDLLLEAHSLAARQGLEAGLVLAGEGPLRGQAESAGATVLGFVGAEELDALYTAALGLVSASREEGFGFTPLEALARGTPAVVPDLPPFRETLGDAALSFPPGDAEALAGALLRLEREPGLRKRLVAAAAEPLARLSWAEAARRTREVLAAAAAAA